MAVSFLVKMFMTIGTCCHNSRRQFTERHTQHNDGVEKKDPPIFLSGEIKNMINLETKASNKMYTQKGDILFILL